MNTNKNVYNIIWADDEIDSLLTDIKEGIFSRNGFHVIATAHTGKELEAELANHKDRVDAVITDANYSLGSSQVEDERTITGFSHARSLCNFKYNKQIPFFLFTGRTEELLRELYQKDGDYSFELEFPRKVRWFHKGEQDLMLDAIKKAVDERRSPSFLVRNKFSEELRAAGNISTDVEYRLFNILTQEFTCIESQESISNNYNELRSIFETIRNRCVEAKILPNLSLNSVPKFLEGKFVEGYQLNEDIMPKVLIHSLSFFTRIVQEGSHSESQLNIREYEGKFNNSNLYKSVLYILLDLILWYDKLIKDLPNIKLDELWTYQSVKGKVDVQTYNDRVIYTVNGDYEISNNGDLKEGCEIEILEYTKNTNNRPSLKISYYVHKDKYKILNTPE